MARSRRSNLLALAVLACLYERPMHPYEMATTMRDRKKDESIKLNFGSLYTVVDGLHRNHLIASQEVEREGRRPERTVYQLTDDGRIELFDWMNELLSRPVKEYTRFEAALSLLPVLPPDEAVARLERRCRCLEIDIASAKAIFTLVDEQKLPRLFIVEHEYEVTLREAELAWTQALIADIRTGSLGGVEFWRSLHERPVGGPSRGEDILEQMRQHDESS